MNRDEIRSAEPYDTENIRKYLHTINPTMHVSFPFRPPYHRNNGENIIPLGPPSAFRSAPSRLFFGGPHPVSGPRQLSRHQSQKNKYIGDDENGHAAPDDAPTLVPMRIHFGLFMHPGEKDKYRRWPSLCDGLQQWILPKV